MPTTPCEARRRRGVDGLVTARRGDHSRRWGTGLAVKEREEELGGPTGERGQPSNRTGQGSDPP